MLPCKRTITTDVALWQRLTDEGHTTIAFMTKEEISERDWRWAEVFAFNNEDEKKYVEKTIWDNFYQLDFFRGETRKVLIGTTDELAEAFGIKSAKTAGKPKT